jgi:phage-related protein
MEGPHRLKHIIWIGSSRKDLKSFPDDVKDLMGYALYQAQRGGKALSAKPLTDFGGAGILEIVADHRTDTYRAVYTVKFGDFLYVLHAFQKKSKQGVTTPKTEIALIKARLKTAEVDYKSRQAR